MNQPAVEAFGPEALAEDLGTEPWDLILQLRSPGRRGPDLRRLENEATARVQALFLAGLTMHEIANVWRLPLADVEARIRQDPSLDLSGSAYQSSAFMLDGQGGERDPEWPWPWPPVIDSPDDALAHCGLVGVSAALGMDEVDLYAALERQERTSELLRLRDFRDAALVQLRWAGFGLDDIGREWGLTRERVRQIISRRGGPTAQQLKEVRTRHADYLRARDEASVLSLIKSGDATDVATAAMLLGWPENRVRDCLSPRTKSLLAAPKKPWKTASAWSRDDVIATLQAIAAIQDDDPDRRSALSGEDYDRHKEDFGGPSRATISKMFGSWNEALEAAGLATFKGKPKSSRYTDELLWTYLVKYVRDPQVESVTFYGFDEWRVMHAPGAPSAQFIRNRLGSWTQIRAEAFRRAAIAEETRPVDNEDARELDDFEYWAAEETLNRVKAGGANPAEPIDYDRYLIEGAPKSAHLETLFGSWGSALGALGWDPSELVTTRAVMTDQAVIDQLREYVRDFMDQSEVAPTANDWDTDRDKRATVGSWSYVRRFQSWRDALARAGVPDDLLPPRYGFFSDDVLVAALRAGLLEHGPLTLDAWDALRPAGAPSGGTYLRRFGSWAQALRRAGSDVS